jgi:hypothetical protein
MKLWLLGCRDLRDTADIGARRDLVAYGLVSLSTDISTYAISRVGGKRECRTVWTLHSDGRHKQANILRDASGSLLMDEWMKDSQ